MQETGRAGLQRRPQLLGESLGAEKLWSEHFEASLAAEYKLSPIAHVTLDRHGCICRLNLAAANLLKGDQFQLLNVPFLAFVERSYCRAFLDHLAACIRLRQRVSTELMLASHTRSAALVELQSTPGVDQSGEKENQLRGLYPEIDNITRNYSNSRPMRSSSRWKGRSRVPIRGR